MHAPACFIYPIPLLYFLTLISLRLARALFTPLTPDISCIFPLFVRVVLLCQPWTQQPYRRLAQNIPLYSVIIIPVSYIINTRLAYHKFDLFPKSNCLARLRFRYRIVESIAIKSGLGDHFYPVSHRYVLDGALYSFVCRE